MARIKIDLPENFNFQTEIPVRITDLNYGGHVGNDTILSLMHEARVQFFRHLGFEGELNLDGISIIMTDSAIVYKAESFYGDKLTVEVAAGDYNKLGFDLFYKLSNKESGKEVARGKTGIVCFDYEKRKITPLPDALRIKLNGE
jgi:acyl-CoA thioester hydrolase